MLGAGASVAHRGVVKSNCGWVVVIPGGQGSPSKHGVGWGELVQGGRIYTVVVNSFSENVSSSV